MAYPVTPEVAMRLMDAFERAVLADFSIIKEIEYFDGWQTYEESGGILVFIGIDDSIQVADYGHCVMCDDDNRFDPREVTREEADRLIAVMTKAAENSNNEY